TSTTLPSGLRNGNGFPVYLCEDRIHVLEIAIRTPLNYSPTKLGLLIGIVEIDNRERNPRIALRVFRFSEPSPVQIRMRSSSRPIQTGTLCGEPSGMRVAK